MYVVTVTQPHTRSAVIYCRLSPTPRGEESKSGNLAQQEQKCRERAEAKGWTVSEVITDRDTSASKGHRQGWARVIQLVHAGAVDVVLARHPDRMYRQMRELEDLVDLSEKTGVMLATIEGDYDLTTPTGRLTARILAAAARGEMKMKAERQRLGHERRVDGGRPWWNSRPFGFERNGEHRSHEAEALRGAYSDLLSGQSLYSIARGLNDRGILSPRAGQYRQRRDGSEAQDSGRWRSSNLRAVLAHPRNAGIHTHRGRATGKAATWEPIVSRDIYDAALSLLQEPGRRPSNNDGKRLGLLTNLAQCGKVLAGDAAERLGKPDGAVCEGKLIRAMSKARADGTKYALYRCRECLGVTIPVEWLDSYVMRQMIQRAEEWSSQLAGQNDATARAEIDALRAEEVKLSGRSNELAELFADGLIDRAALTAGTDKARARLDEIREQVAELTVGAVSREAIASDSEYLFDLFDRMDEAGGRDAERLRAIFVSMAEAIVCLPRGKGQRMPKSSDVEIVWRKSAKESL